MHQCDLTMRIQHLTQPLFSKKGLNHQNQTDNSYKDGLALLAKETAKALPCLHV